MERGTLKLAEGEPIPVRFERTRSRGWLAPERVEDFVRLLQVLDGRATVRLQSAAGDWSAEVLLTRADSVDPTRGRFGYTVQSEPRRGEG